MRITALLLALAAPAAAQQAAADSTPHPITLLAREPGAPGWRPLVRLRDAEGTYRGHRQFWQVYVQLRAQLEATFGNHREAMRWADTFASAKDSAATWTVPPGATAVHAVDAIVAAADAARVVMVNERHHAGSDRLLTLRLLAPLHAKGFRYFAAEALDEADSGLVRRGYALDRVTGGYTDEPAFAELVREALRLGYTIVPYEMTRAQDTAAAGLTRQQHRDRTQARNLYERTLARDPSAKVLVHAGFWHVKEREDDGWFPMALGFRALSGIDPVTVDQTTWAEQSAPRFEPAEYRAVAAGPMRDEPVVLRGADGAPLNPARFGTDLEVFSPRTRYDEHGRPTWMRMDGRRVGIDFAVTECAARACVVDAHLLGEPDSATVLDRTDANRTRVVRLYVPRDRELRVRVMDPTGAVLRAERIRVPPTARP